MWADKIDGRDENQTAQNVPEELHTSGPSGKAVEEQRQRPLAYQDSWTVASQRHWLRHTSEGAVCAQRESNTGDLHLSRRFAQLKGDKEETAASTAKEKKSLDDDVYSSFGCVSWATRNGKLQTQYLC